MIRPDTWCVDTWQGAQLRDMVERNLDALATDGHTFIRGLIEDDILHGVIRDMEQEALAAFILDLAIGWSLLSKGGPE